MLAFVLFIESGVRIFMFPRFFLSVVLSLCSLWYPLSLSSKETIDGNKKRPTSNSSTLDDMTDEDRVSLLIATTEKTLETLKKIQENLELFRKQEQICIAEGTSRKNTGNDSLFELSRQAWTLLDLIKEHQLQSYFRKDFIEELEMISKAYKLKAIPSAKL